MTQLLPLNVEKPPYEINMTLSSASVISNAIKQLNDNRSDGEIDLSPDFYEASSHGVV